MKREEIKAIFPEITDEQLKSVMDLNGKEVERYKKLEAELQAKNEQFEKLNTEFETLKTANADGEEWKAKFEALQADNEAKARQAEADRILREKTESVNNRFNTAVGEKKFIHEAIRESYLKKFGEAIESTDYQGKSDVEIFHELTKDDGKAFQGATVVKLAGGGSQSAESGKITREAFNKMSYKGRLELFNKDPDLYNELTEKGE